MPNETANSTAPPGNDWHPYIDCTGTRPPDASPAMHLMSGATLELWRPEWGENTSFTNDKHRPMPDEMNVAGLYWRLA